MVSTLEQMQVPDGFHKSGLSIHFVIPSLELTIPCYLPKSNINHLMSVVEIEYLSDIALLALLSVGTPGV